MHHASLLHGLPLLTQYAALAAISALLCILWRCQGLTGDDETDKPQDPMVWGDQDERGYH